MKGSGLATSRRLCVEHLPDSERRVLLTILDGTLKSQEARRAKRNPPAQDGTSRAA